MISQVVLVVMATSALLSTSISSNGSDFTKKISNILCYSLSLSLLHTFFMTNWLTVDLSRGSDIGGIADFLNNISSSSIAGLAPTSCDY